MILIYTGFSDLDEKLSQTIPSSRTAHYPEYLLQEDKSGTVILSPHAECKMPFKDFLFALRQQDKRIILLLGDPNSEYIGYALALGIYDIIFDPITSEKITDKILRPANFSDVQELYLGLKGKVSFSGEIVETEKQTETMEETEEKPVIEKKEKPVPEKKVKIIEEVKKIGLSQEETAIAQIEGMMRLLGQKLGTRDINQALTELEQALVEEIA
ncbi:MAG: hypothetical protein QME35_03030 [Thermoanaerobacteraceae bacterium]|nr:hypothetical protein [Thermoanaerobacteraceae bacterium]